ncbi:MAG: mechanosensitive ion channel [Sumerlaeia bacterium]
MPLLRFVFPATLYLLLTAAAFADSALYEAGQTVRSSGSSETAAAPPPDSPAPRAEPDPTVAAPAGAPAATDSAPTTPTATAPPSPTPTASPAATLPPSALVVDLGTTRPAVLEALEGSVLKTEMEVKEFAERFGLGWLAYIFFDIGLVVNGSKITLFKLLIALLIFVIGLLLARLTSAWARKRVFKKFRLNRASSDYLERLVRVLLVVIIAFFALDFSGIPLSIFAFLGGAVALAVGFGAQEILANFIGGLILLFEKPIRPNDLIEFDGEQGRVEEIGARRTRIRLPGNVDMLVPNRQLVENKLINWTYGRDDQVRTEVKVGIAYGSPTRDAERLLRQAIDEHPRVDKTPTPIVLFEDFGDNALGFTCFFWARVKSFMEQRQIQSDIRFRIDELFKEANITIAFPQRDVHLDTLSPLKIRMMRGREGAE